MNADAYRGLVRSMQARDWPAALHQIDHALLERPRFSRLLIHRAQCLRAMGRRQEAFEAAVSAQESASGDAFALDAVGTFFSYAGDQQRALRAYCAAVRLAPDNPQFIFNRATVRRFLGEFAGAEADYDRVIALRPADFEAFKNRSDLRTQTSANNHLPELEALAARPFPDWRGYVQIHYALAKEYEDVGEWGRSFDALQRAARRRRQHLTYDVAVDVATVDWIMEAYPAGSTPESAGCSQEAPVFIVGLPRSGTTLVDRILGSHSRVFSAGELNDLALAIVDAVQRRQSAAPPMPGRSIPGRPMPGRPMPRPELIARSAEIDFALLGKDYLRRARAAAAIPDATAGAGADVGASAAAEAGADVGASAAAGAGADAGARRAAPVIFTDKMPLNYLYCGLIRRALPRAKIVHVTREPMAVCYAMYKTLFKDAYPFSYDLGDIARYYIAYRRLMAHWDTTLPGAIYRLSYEELVADQIGQSRELLRFCGLEWEEGCAEFHLNAAATTTASAAQVRQRIYDSSVDQWRHYEQQLAPLREHLSAAGVAT